MYKRDGFTLVELAVTLTIIAAVLATITGGLAIKKQADLRGVITEMETYRDGFVKFQMNYKSPPGDFINADTLWAGDCASGTTCNGNGNGVVNAVYSSISNETSKTWKHMQRADLLNYIIEEITLSNVTDLNYDIVPKSKYFDAGYTVIGGEDMGVQNAGYRSVFYDTLNPTVIHGLFLGAPYSDGPFTNGSMGPKDAYNIDTKIDDGAVNSAGSAIGAQTGFFRSMNATNSFGRCALASGNIYSVGNDDIACLIAYQLDNR